MTTSHRQLGQIAEFVGSYVPEDVVLQTARGLAAEVGLAPIAPATGAALRMLASASGARAVVEIGTGTGLSGLWLLRGMRPDGVLTTIDLEAEHQRMARRLFLEAGFPTPRTRIITGRALEVLPRLSDHAYDMIFVDGHPGEYEAYTDAAARLLRNGGLLVLHGRMVGSIRDSELWIPALLPVGDGLLAAVRT